MKNKHCFVLLLYLCSSYFIFAQNCQTPVGNCAGTPICDLQTFGINPEPLGSPDFFPTCPSNVIDNEIWYNFTPATSSIIMVISSANCRNSMGIQAGVYADCPYINPNSEVVPTQCGCTTGPITFAMDALVVGEPYFLLVDGCAGDVCEYFITIVSGSIEPPTPASNSISGPTTACVGDTLTYEVDNPYLSNITWAVPGQILYQDCETVTTVWTSFGSSTVSALYNTPCHGDTILQLGVSVDSVEVINQASGNYCFGEPGYLYPVDQQIYPEGTHFISNDNCDTVTILTVEQYGTPVLIHEFICPGDSTIIGGQTFAMDTTTTITLAGAARNGCDSTINVLVNVLLNDAFISPAANLSCANSSITLSSPANSLGNLSFSWSTLDGNIITDSTEASVQVNAAGTYVLVMESSTTQNGQQLTCTIIDSVTVLDTSTDLILDLIVTDVTCTGLEDGAITVAVQNGIPPYTYFWSVDSNFTSNATITDLAPGPYSVAVIDAEGCVGFTDTTLQAAVPFMVTSTVVDCDSTNGSATVTVTNNNIDPQYNWSTGDTTASINNLAFGWYSVTVTDRSTGCRSHQNIEVPLDSSCYVRISGTVINDEPGRNCQTDASDIPVGNIMVTLSNGLITFTDQDGQYEFITVPGLYTIDINLNHPAYARLCADPISIDATTAGGNYPDQDFYLKIIPAFDLGLKVDKGRHRPGFTRNVRICVMNYGSAPTDFTLTFTHDSVQTFVSSFPMEDSYDPATYTMTASYSNHQPGQVIVYNVALALPASVPIGEPLNLSFKVTPLQGDLDTTNNCIDDCIVFATNAYDPNDKSAEPMGIEPEGFISPDDSLLSYLIRFQNTGNDTAYTVVLRDTLDRNLDLGTLVPGPSSHPYTVSVDKDRVLEFRFENIYLPDSNINEPASNGFVFYDIQLLPDLEPLTKIYNQAAIYFDFNEPIITNTTEHTIAQPITTHTHSPTIQPLQAQVIPNPSQGTAYLQLELPQADRLTLQLYAYDGQLIWQWRPSQIYSAGEHQISLPTDQLSGGLYLLSIQTDQGQRQTRKWTIMK